MIGPLVEFGGAKVLFGLLHVDADQLPLEEVFLVGGQLGIFFQGLVDHLPRLGGLSAVIIGPARAHVLRDDG